jgi:hypothetical protein
VAWPLPELAAGVVAGVLRLPEELLPEELLLDEPPEEVLPEVPEPVDLEPAEPAGCALCVAFWDEGETEAPAAPGRL